MLRRERVKGVIREWINFFMVVLSFLIAVWTRHAIKGQKDITLLVSLRSRHEHACFISRVFPPQSVFSINNFGHGHDILPPCIIMDDLDEMYIFCWNVCSLCNPYFCFTFKSSLMIHLDGYRSRSGCVLIECFMYLIHYGFIHYWDLLWLPYLYAVFGHCAMLFNPMSVVAVIVGLNCFCFFHFW